MTDKQNYFTYTDNTSDSNDKTMENLHKQIIIDGNFKLTTEKCLKLIRWLAKDGKDAHITICNSKIGYTVQFVPYHPCLCGSHYRTAETLEEALLSIINDAWAEFPDEKKDEIRRILL